MKRKDAPKEIGDKFNDYFVNVGPSLANKFDQNRKNRSKYLNDNFPKSMFRRDIIPEEITKMITEIYSNKSCGIDEISPKVIQKLGPLISRPLCHIFNLTFSTGNIPEELKTSIICRTGNSLLNMETRNLKK